MTQVILLNGPPRCGKDTVGEMIARKIPGTRVYKFAEALKCATHDLYGSLHHLGRQDKREAARYESVKDQPQDDFFGLTPRQAYIAVSETLLKPLHGTDFFGRVLVEKILLERPRLAVVADSGFREEAVPVLWETGFICRILRLHRPNCTFDGDSRSYWSTKDLPGAYTVKVLWNSRDLAALETAVDGYLRGLGFFIP